MRAWELGNGIGTGSTGTSGNKNVRWSDDKSRNERHWGVRVWELGSGIGTGGTITGESGKERRHYKHREDSMGARRWYKQCQEQE